LAITYAIDTMLPEQKSEHQQMKWTRPVFKAQNLQPFLNARTPRHARHAASQKVKTQVKIQRNNASSELRASALLRGSGRGCSRGVVAEDIVPQALASVHSIAHGTSSITHGISDLAHILQAISEGAHPGRVSCLEAHWLRNWDGCAVDHGSQGRSGQAEGGEEGRGLSGELHFDGGWRKGVEEDRLRVEWMTRSWWREEDEEEEEEIVVLLLWWWDDCELRCWIKVGP
jgi:hypothetical protein